MGAHLGRVEQKMFYSAGTVCANALWFRGKRAILGAEKKASVFLVQKI